MLSKILPSFRRKASTPIAQAGVPREGQGEERGSALIISLMVMVILTMMGVTFLVLSEQENKISVNERDYEQTLYLAEAAVNMGITWFNDPTSTNVFKPTAAQMNLTLRKGAIIRTGWTNVEELDPARPITQTDVEVDGSAGAVYTGGALGGTASQFDKPYRGSPSFGLWGRRETPDVLVCGSTTLDVDGDGTLDCNANMRAYMRRLNDALLMSTSLRTDGHSSRDFGVLEIEQIRVYRPPTDFTLKTRYGIATIEAVAVKRVGGQVVARRSVREVLQEIPFPGPGGAIEADGDISMGGSSEVHWGPVVSTSSNADISNLPNGANTPDSPTARSTSARFGFHYTINPAAWMVQTDGRTWLTQALAGPATIKDASLIFRARRYVTALPFNTNVQPSPYTIGGAISADRSNFFQKQILRFPPIDYDVWKSVAQSGQKGMYYFKWDTGTNFKQDGVGASRSFTAWVGLYTTGVFFFDTKDSVRPVPALTNCTPALSTSPGFYVEGFLYMNSVGFGSAGNGGGVTKEVNMPGEPFLDDGIDLHGPSDTTGDDCICLRYDPTSQNCVLGCRPIGFTGHPGAQTGDSMACPTTNVAGGLLSSTMTSSVAYRESQTYRNAQWDTDLDNNGISDAGTDLASNSGWTRFTNTNPNNAQGGWNTGSHGYGAGVVPGYPAGPAAQGKVEGTDWKRDPRFENHIDAFGGTNANRQPYEPFLNFDTDDGPGTVASNEQTERVNWQMNNEPVEKDAGGTITKVTTRARDATGPLSSIAMSINGVAYSEGPYDGSGNMVVYGSMLMKGGYSSTGSLETYFNEDLVKGRFPPPSWKLPRVYSTARDTQ